MFVPTAICYLIYIYARDSDRRGVLPDGSGKGQRGRGEGRQGRGDWWKLF